MQLNLLNLPNFQVKRLQHIPNLLARAVAKAPKFSHTSQWGLYGVRVRQCLNCRSCGLGWCVRWAEVLLYYMGSTSCKGKVRFWGFCSPFSQWQMPLGRRRWNVSDSYATTWRFRSANVSLESSIRGLFGDVVTFKINVGDYEKLAKT